jgi:hypothetical protein
MKSTRANYVDDVFRCVRFEGAQQVQIAPLSANGLVDEGLSHLDVSGHSDLRVNLQRFAE